MKMKPFKVQTKTRTIRMKIKKRKDGVYEIVEAKYSGWRKNRERSQAMNTTSIRPNAAPASDRRLTVKIPGELYHAMITVAKANGVTPSQLLTQAIERELRVKK
jgi:hypothetical protein